MLPLVADGALDADGDPALFAHLARCQACQDSLARHDLVSLALAGAPHRALSLHRHQLPMPVALGAAAAFACAGLISWQLVGNPAPAAAARSFAERTRLPPSETTPQAIDGIPSDAAGESREGLDADTGSMAVDNAQAAVQHDDAQAPDGSIVLLQDGQEIFIPASPHSQARPPLTHPVGLDRY